MTMLDTFESDHRRRVRIAARAPQPVSPLRAALLAAAIMPFALLEMIFVPILGQMLVLFGLVVTAIYLYYRRSVILLVSVFAGAAAVTALMVAVSSFSPEFARRGIYPIMGGATMVLAAFDVYMGALLWRHFERAADSLTGPSAEQNGQTNAPR